MGWFSNFCSSVASGVTSLVSAAGSVASMVWTEGKRIAAKVVDFVANEAEQVVGAVKRVWKTVKPYVATASTLLKAAAAATKAYPMLSGALSACGRVLDALLAFEESPLAKRLDAAIKWVIDMAKELHARLLSDEELVEALKHKRTFEDAAKQSTGEEEQHALRVTAFMVESLRLRRQIADLIEGDAIADFDHYLRLRAAQKLLEDAEQTLRKARSVDAISQDDLFLLKVGAALLEANPTLSDADAERLNSIIEVRFHKSLLPFVFEELMLAWAGEMQSREKEQRTVDERLIEDHIKYKRALRDKKNGRLSEEEAAKVTQTGDEIAARMEALKTLRADNAWYRILVQAAEGFMQVLEKDEETLIREDLGHIATHSAQVGKIILDCLQHGKPFESLTEDQRMLVVNFSNVFESAANARASQLVKVDV
ncbi:hypothetical protein [Burkholderia vietnamiensis]|uniref:Uncharacterized protein n=1 Tax=Burkholderia vietnamiensis TaxID=60552 RepID=A0ABS1B4Y7_BURVI|nr:hypothetical protein [Burkholderia vietnamiensis]MBJ9691455.1 hypothetical protein [Burkholderia vietnamiensis]MCA8270584.1 hypothetical protein [Burkholderia vietnamiensis]UKV75408.1 hypothetical protein FOC29_29370 [Burkholderia vietnamiensis]HDR8926210.1 hypothetical protein [Burkholderia vietnamiensis]HDR9217139.1 hypothetical protein [Burkholderia vietnamiensis]